MASIFHGGLSDPTCLFAKASLLSLSLRSCLGGLRQFVRDKAGLLPLPPPPRLSPLHLAHVPLELAHPLCAGKVKDITSPLEFMDRKLELLIKSVNTLLACR